MTVTDRPMNAPVEPRRAAYPARLAVAPIAYLRVVGFLLVLTFSAYQNSGYDGFAGWPGEELWERLLVGGAAGSVDAFFVITTFLVSRSVVRGALLEGPLVSSRALLVRQASALLPAYYVAVFMVWVIANPKLAGHWEDLLLHLTFTQVFSDTYIFWTLGPAWFIAIAVQFYVLIAICARQVQHSCHRLPDRATRVRLLVGVAAGSAAACWAYKLVAAFVVQAPATSWSVWFSPVSRLDLLGLGIGLALISVLRPHISVPAGWLMRAAAAGTALVGILNYPNEIAPATQPAFWQDSALGLAAFLLLLPSMGSRSQDKPAGPSASITVRVVTVATLSYGVYIWQEPILRVLNNIGVLPPDSSPWAFPVTAAVLLVLSLATSKIGYHLIEEPGRSFAAWSHRRTGPAAPRTGPRIDRDDAGGPAPFLADDGSAGGQGNGTDHAPAVSLDVSATAEMSATSPLDAPARVDLSLRPMRSFLVAAVPVVLLGALAVIGVNQRVATAAEAATAAAAVLGPSSPLAGLSWPGSFAAYQIAGLETVLASVGQQSVIDSARAVLLVVMVAVCLLLWPAARRLGLSPATAALAVALCGLPLAAATYGAVDAGGLAALWLAAAVVMVSRTRDAPAAQVAAAVSAAAAAAIAALTAPIAAVGLLALAAHAVLAGAVRGRRPKWMTWGCAALLIGAASYVAVQSTGSGPWVVSGGTPVAPALLVAVLAVGAAVVALTWRFSAPRRPAATAAAVMLACASVPGPHTTTALVLAVPVLAVLTAVVVDVLTDRSQKSRRALLAAAVVLLCAASAPLVLGAAAPDPDRTRLGTWVRTQLDPAAALQVDPLTAAELIRAGVPAERLVPAGTPAPGGALSVLATRPGAPQVAPTADSRLLVALPDGPGGAPIAVLRPGPGNDRGAQRHEFDSQLASNEALTLTPTAAYSLRRGDVDLRLATTIASLASTHRLAISEFAAAPDEPRAAVRRTALITEVDGTPTYAPGATESVQRWLAGQELPYKPGVVELHQGVLVVRYTIPAPLGTSE